jgi:hypothetical protein
LILGLLVVGVQVSPLPPQTPEREWRPNGMQWASSYGINVIPYNRLQKYFTSIDLRSAVQDNVAFKLSFGTTFAMAAFMEF